MAATRFGLTWWGQRWIAALEALGALYANRLPRGRTYARRGAVTDLALTAGSVSARVQGSRARPYRVTLQLPAFDDATWEAVLAELAGELRHAAVLLDGQLPPHVDDVFATPVACRCSRGRVSSRPPARARTGRTRASTSPRCTTSSGRPSTPTRSFCRACADGTAAGCWPGCAPHARAPRRSTSRRSSRDPCRSRRCRPRPCGTAPATSPGSRSTPSRRPTPPRRCAASVRPRVAGRRT